MGSVTAIISAYLAPEYLASRIVNLRAQFPQPEIVAVCQAGSVEDAILRDFPFVVVIRTTDIPTIYDAWNMAIDVASGDYITNANCDDRLYPGALKILAKVLDDDASVGIAYSYSDIVNDVGLPPVNRYEWPEGGLDELLLGCFIGPMPMWRKELHNICGRFDPTLHVAGDYDFWLRVAAQGFTMRLVKQALGAYTNRPQSAEHRQSLRTLWETARVRSRYS